mgnify:CR=1 FL=1
MPLRRLVAGGTQLRPFSKAIMDACYAAAMELYKETSDKNPNFKKHLEHMQAFQKDQVLWFRVTEATFDNFQLRTYAYEVPKVVIEPAMRLTWPAPASVG